MRCSFRKCWWLFGDSPSAGIPRSPSASRPLTSSTKGAGPAPPRAPSAPGPLTPALSRRESFAQLVSADIFGVCRPAIPLCPSDISPASGGNPGVLQRSRIRERGFVYCGRWMRCGFRVDWWLFGVFRLGGHPPLLLSDFWGHRAPLRLRRRGRAPLRPGPPHPGPLPRRRLLQNAGDWVESIWPLVPTCIPLRARFACSRPLSPRKGTVDSGFRRNDVEVPE